MSLAAAAYAALKIGDFTTFANEMTKVGQILQQLQTITGTTPTPGGATPSPCEGAGQALLHFSMFHRAQCLFFWRRDRCGTHRPLVQEKGCSATVGVSTFSSPRLGFSQVSVRLACPLTT